jgi:hypothetical protein
MLNYDFIFPVRQVEEYVGELNSTPIVDYLLYIEKNSTVCSLSSRDIFQFSNIEDSTRNLCKLVKAENDPGLKHVAVGKILLNDGKPRNDAAYTKYGENHAKFAEDLGIMHSLGSIFFLSCLGQILNDLDDVSLKKLLTRLILRLRLVQKLYLDSLKGKVNLRECLSVLSETTFIRRSSNIKTVLKLLAKSTEYDFHDFVKKIDISTK